MRATTSVARRAARVAAWVVALACAGSSAAGSKDSIDSALALGSHLVHTESQKHRRHAIRAVLLAAFLMKGLPVGQHWQLRQRRDSLSLEALKREFAFDRDSESPAGRARGFRAGLRKPGTLLGLASGSGSIRGLALIRARSSAAGRGPSSGDPGPRPLV
jgi:hypothetical protein